MFNPIRIEYIVEKVKEHFSVNDREVNCFKNLKFLDIGCGVD